MGRMVTIMTTFYFLLKALSDSLFKNMIPIATFNSSTMILSCEKMKWLWLMEVNCFAQIHSSVSVSAEEEPRSTNSSPPSTVPHPLFIPGHPI